MQFWQLKPVAGMTYIGFSILLGWQYITYTVMSEMFIKIMAAHNRWHLVSISVPSWIRFVSVMNLIPFCSLKYLEYSDLILFSNFTVKQKRVKQKIFKTSQAQQRGSFQSASEFKTLTFIVEICEVGGEENTEQWYIFLSQCRVIRSISLHPVIGLGFCVCFKNGIHSTDLEWGNTTVPEEWFELG